MSDSNSSIAQEVLKSIDEVRELLTDEEKLLIDAYLDAHATLHNACEFLKLGSASMAQTLCDGGRDKRMTLLQAFLDSKKVKVI